MNQCPFVSTARKTEPIPVQDDHQASLILWTQHSTQLRSTYPQTVIEGEPLCKPQVQLTIIQSRAPDSLPVCRLQATLPNF